MANMVLRLIIVMLSLGAFATLAEDTWRNKMQKVATAMSDLVPYLYPTADKDPKGLLEKVEKLHDIVEALDIKKDHMIKNHDYDPGLIFFANSFKDNIDQAYLSLKAGYPDYTRYMLRSTAAACIGCHSRTSGPQFPVVHAFEESLKSAPWITKMEFLAASRQFTAAYDDIIKQLEKPASQPVSALDLERGARLGLTIAVRVQKDPAQAAKLAQALKTSKNATLPMRKVAGHWLSDIQKWKNQKPKTYKSSAQMIKDAKQMIQSAQDAGVGAEVQFLRASSLMHGLLRTYPDAPERAEAFYLLGLSYNHMQDLGIWEIQETYFEACILDKPHSDVAQKCYRELEKSVIAGYAGSSGIHIPPLVQLRLNELKAKAEKTEGFL